MIKELSKKYNYQWKYLPFLSQLAELKSKPYKRQNWGI